MKRFIVILLSMFFLAHTAYAQQYHISVLQVSNIQVFQNAYEGFMENLKAHGIIEGKNLIISRHIIDADLDAGLWQKMGILLKIKNTASKIIGEDPNLVLTIGTSATKYSRDKVTKAGIPLVFTCVANPVAAGCTSMTQAGQGCTGATIYIDPAYVINIIHRAFPSIKTMGIIHSDDDNGVAFADEAIKKQTEHGIRILTRQVSKSDKIGPAAMELVGEGIDMFGIPPDTYYALRGNQPSKDLTKICRDKKTPGVAFMSSGAPGCILYIGPSMRTNGSLSAGHAIRILKDGIKPEEIPIAIPKDPTILCDQESFKIMGIDIPIDILKLAKPFSESL